jgi:EAL domain-containing protein (putative c-di-GMP-specific phosphodiesterase class I)
MAVARRLESCLRPGDTVARLGGDEFTILLEDLDTQQGAAEIVRTIVMLARSLGMEVIAEGIETPEQLAQLSKLECEYGQGYNLSTARRRARWCKIASSGRPVSSISSGLNRKKVRQAWKALC